jgi:hypothetical protein
MPACVLPFFDDLSIDEASFRRHLSDFASRDRSCAGSVDRRRLAHPRRTQRGRRGSQDQELVYLSKGSFDRLDIVKVNGPARLTT